MGFYLRKYMELGPKGLHELVFNRDVFVLLFFLINLIW